MRRAESVGLDLLLPVKRARFAPNSTELTLHAAIIWFGILIALHLTSLRRSRAAQTPNQGVGEQVPPYGFESILPDQFSGLAVAPFNFFGHCHSWPRAGRPGASGAAIGRGCYGPETGSQQLLFLHLRRAGPRATLPSAHRRAAAKLKRSKSYGSPSPCRNPRVFSRLSPGLRLKSHRLRREGES
jgi:hypothetical protein